MSAKIILTPPLLLAFLGACGLSNPPPGVLVGVQGAQLLDDDRPLEVTLEVVPNTPNVVNDTVLVLAPGGELDAFRATVDPGTRHDQAGPGGMAHLVLYSPLLWRTGHRNDNPTVQALRAVTAQHAIWRDADADDRQDASDPVESGGSSILIHRIGGQGTIGNWSLGCIGIHDTTRKQVVWDRFWRHAQHIEQEMAGGIPMLLVRGADLAAWSKGRRTWAPQLAQGARGPWVVVLQHLLNGVPSNNVKTGKGRDKGRDNLLGVDGDWRRATQQRVLDVQQAGGLEVDGIVGKRTWAYLRELNDLTAEEVVEMVARTVLGAAERTES